MTGHIIYTIALFGDDLGLAQVLVMDWCVPASWYSVHHEYTSYVSSHCISHQPASNACRMAARFAGTRLSKWGFVWQQGVCWTEANCSVRIVIIEQSLCVCMLGFTNTSQPHVLHLTLSNCSIHVVLNSLSECACPPHVTTTPCT